MSVRTIQSAASLALLAGASLAQGTLFPVSHPYPVGLVPYGSALADVNADGNLDCFVAISFSDQVSVLLGTGTGTFVPQPSLTVGDGPRELVLADLNGDTHLDLVAVHTGDFVSVSPGDGLGGFGAAAQFPTTSGGFPVCIDSGDVNNDGKLDIVVGNQATPDLCVLRGDGLGGFTAPLSYYVGFTVEQLELAHLDADGFLDCVMVAGSDDMLAININDGSGNLFVGTPVPSPHPRDLDVGDVNGDGNTDVVVCDHYNDSVRSYLGDGAGGLILTHGNSLGLGGPHTPTTVMLTDASGDGLLDMITYTQTSKALFVHIGVGNGEFYLALKSTVAQGGPRAVAGDLNHDGFSDVVTSEFSGNTVRAHISSGVGSWERYCTPKVNSLGCVPTIYALGTPSISNVRPFTVYVYKVLDNKPGLFLYTVNGTQSAIPFQGGTLCIGPAAIRRTPGKSSGNYPEFPSPNCEGKYTIDFNKFAQGLLGGNPSPGLLVLGNTYQIQAWSRDPGFPAPNNSGLSPALDVTLWQ